MQDGQADQKRTSVVRAASGEHGSSSHAEEEGSRASASSVQQDHHDKDR